MADATQAHGRAVTKCSHFVGLSHAKVTHQICSVSRELFCPFAFFSDLCNYAVQNKRRRANARGKCQTSFGTHAHAILGQLSTIFTEMVCWKCLVTLLHGINKESTSSVSVAPYRHLGEHF
uniref:(northern house mosquito) hypothetical protein n=1 Tax=Culex pipiens TaxID=7175 RepID=A0A8D8B6P5_CULPI